MTAPFVVDASVAAAWVLLEALSETACELLRAEMTFIAPDLIVAEVGNAVWKAVRCGEASNLQAHAPAAILGGAIKTLHRTLPLLPMASALARELNHPIYGCLYLALAIREGGIVVTADVRMAKLSALKEIAVRLITAPQPSSSA